jgi:hypothetical protein
VSKTSRSAHETHQAGNQLRLVHDTAVVCRQFIYVFHAGITCMACAALWMRLRAGAIGPAVAVHLSYNSIIAILQVAASLAGN